MRQTEQRSCQGKRRHRTFLDATIAVRESGKTFGDLTLFAYRCDFCGFYHVGHPPRSLQKRLRYERLLQLIERANRK